MERKIEKDGEKRMKVYSCWRRSVSAGLRRERRDHNTLRWQMTRQVFSPVLLHISCLVYLFAILSVLFYASTSTSRNFMSLKVRVPQGNRIFAQISCDHNASREEKLEGLALRRSDQFRKVFLLYQQKYMRVCMYVRIWLYGFRATNALWAVKSPWKFTTQPWEFERFFFLLSFFLSLLYIVTLSHSLYARVSVGLWDVLRGREILLQSRVSQSERGIWLFDTIESALHAR